LKIFNLLRGPLLEISLTLQPSFSNFPSFCNSANLVLVNLVNPTLVEATTFYLPGNLFFALLKASQTFAKLATLALHENKISPILTLAALPIGLPKAPLIPV